MYTIGQAARLTGVPEASLRAWERRYGLGATSRTAAGYRLYDRAALAQLCTMRSLIVQGWSPGQAARAVREGHVPSHVAPPHAAGPAEGHSSAIATATPDLDMFLTSARLMRAGGVEESLDRGFALGSFEHVVDFWLFPALRALGDGWARGEIDVAAEHAASHAVHRRLSAAFEAAANRSHGPPVVVGLPPGSRHELGALAFATTLRRRGLDVLYIGADVPHDSWQTAVRTHHARAAVLAVVTPDDRPAAAAVADGITAVEPAVMIASGGAFGEGLGAPVRTLATTVAAAAEELDDVLRHTATGEHEQRSVR